MKSVVALARCAGYGAEALDRVIAETAESAGMPEVRGARVLVKPNLLNASAPERAATTHPGFVAAVVRLLRLRGASLVMVGDSPAWQNQYYVGGKTGVREAAESAGAEWVEFSGSCDAGDRENLLVKSFAFADAYGRADLLFNLPKLKTHMLTSLSGAVKNLFGLIPGLSKSAWHMRFPGGREFGTMLADLARAARPDFTFMDAVVAMEGPGPNNGRPRRLDLVLASKDAFALDRIACRIVGYDPDRIVHLAPGIGSGDHAPAIVGLDLETARVRHFETVRTPREGTPFSKILPSRIHAVVRDLVALRPVFDAVRCTRCSGCVKICPAGVLELEPVSGESGRTSGPAGVRIEHGNCIRCYCCHEVCQSDAVRLVRRPFAAWRAGGVQDRQGIRAGAGTAKEE